MIFLCLCQHQTAKFEGDQRDYCTIVLLSSDDPAYGVPKAATPTAQDSARLPPQPHNAPRALPPHAHRHLRPAKEPRGRRHRHRAMQKWRMRAQLSLFAALISVLVLSSFLFSDAPALLRGPPHLSPRTVPFFTARPSALLNDSDWSAACSSPRTFRPRARSRPREREPVGGAPDGCDLFSGKWVYDNGSHPLYHEGGCPYMSDQLACTKHGRPDRDYQHWRWQPHGCDLRKWNATEMLEKLRGKRLMFVGDSLNRGQWISMICLLQYAIPDGRKSITPNAALTIFRAEDYNATVEFYWAPLLMDSNSDDPVNHRLEHRIIRPDSLGKHAAQWEKADILVFNTYLWWRSGTKIKLLWMDEEDQACEEADGFQALELAMDTWADWVAYHGDFMKKKIFFVTMSPTHLWSWEWNTGSEGNCYGEKLPIDRERYWGTGSDISTMDMIGRVLSRLKSKVQVLNITQLSEYRKDGHPSIYRKFWETFSPQQLANPSSYSDCIHWCLPGVPDTWNQLLFHLL